MSKEISIKKATVINFASKYFVNFLQIVYMAVLARILSPDDFGIVAIITVFSTFFMLFSDIGFGSAVIQNKTLSEDDIESIFSFSFFLSIGLAFAFSVFSIPLSMIYNNNVYRVLGTILSISLFFNTLNTVPNALLLKNKKFVIVGLRLVIVTTIAGITTIVLAYLGFRYYALVINYALSSLLGFLWNYKNFPVKLRFRFKKSSITKISSYSGYLFGFNIINYFSRNLDNMLIGRYWGNVLLAYYNKSYQLMVYPVTNLTHVITPVLHPILSEHQNDKDFIYVRFLKTVKILSLLGVLISTYCFFASKEIILIVFGSQWKASAPCFYYLSLSIWSQMVIATSGSMFQALGKTKLQFVRGLIMALITVSAIILGLYLGNLKTVSICVAIAYNLHFFSMLYFLIHKGFQKSSVDFVKRLLPDALIALMLIISLNVANLVTFNNLLVSALYKGVICVSVYCLGLLITKQYKEIANILFKKRNQSKSPLIVVSKEKMAADE